MQLEFYIDVYFLINLFMNGILILLTSKIRKQSVRRLRLLGSACLGALIACLSALMSKVPILILLLIDYVATSILMVMIAFGKKNRRNFIQNYITFLLCSFLLGGVVQSFSQTFRSGNHLKGFIEQVLHGKTTFIILVVLSAILTPFILYFYHVYRQNGKVIGNLYDVKIILWEGKQVDCKGFMDTGNSLKDPLRGWPVIIADQTLLKDELMMVQAQKPASFCAIPYASVGKQTGILYGIRVESVVISNLQDSISTKNVVVALSEHGFTNKDEYCVLLHSDLLGL